MTTNTEKADDDLDALDALESEEKEFVKVSDAPPLPKRLANVICFLGCRD